MIVEESQKMSISGIDDWLFTPQGRYVMAWEQARVDALVSDLFGYNALQFGLPQIDFLAHNRIPLRQTIGPDGPVNVRCDYRELPFASNSIDLVMLPHILEFHADPHQILREVERIRFPMGNWSSAPSIRFRCGACGGTCRAARIPSRPMATSSPCCACVTGCSS